ncbi:MAG TPA: glycosyltransferase family 2 protein [Erysipelotrichaceae bacterium]|nr:glycosyltransferase family 2 protein [Erysipelotrichaceae bacterium]
MKTLYIVIPCYNEEEVIHETTSRLKVKLTYLIDNKTILPNSRVIFVDDGSKDNTWKMINEIHEEDHRFLGLKLTRNRGHQNALLAGLLTAKELADIVISMDADLQDDIEAIDKFIQANSEGHDIVYGVRNKREKDTFFKRASAELFYKFMILMGVEIVFNHADYRLMSKRALNDLEQFDEVNLFLRGLVPLLGYKSTKVYYDRTERFAGESKYPLRKMLAFAFEGITSFSIKPIRLILHASFMMFVISIIIIIYTLYRYSIGETVSGWAFLNISIWFIAGVQTLLLGIVGEYIGKIYSETKKRPKYFIEAFLQDDLI